MLWFFRYRTVFPIIGNNIGGVPDAKQTVLNLKMEERHRRD